MNITSSFDTFLIQTKSALETFQGSPIKKDSKVKRFLAEQLGFNEHSLKIIFDHKNGTKDKASKIISKEITTIKHTMYDTCISTDSMIIDHQSVKLVSSKGDLDTALVELFRTAMPDNDGVVNDVIESSIIEDYIESNYDMHNYKSISDMNDYLRTLDLCSLIEWLIENIQIDELVSPEFIGELTFHRHLIEVDFEDVDFKKENINTDEVFNKNGPQYSNCNTPEPTLQEMISHYYESHGMTPTEIESCTERYIKEWNI
jgi:hypothetical protein